LCREADPAGSDQSGIWCLEAPERAGDRPLEIDVLVVRAAERKVGRRHVAVRDRHEADNDAARIDFDDAAEPGHLCPQIALYVVMDAIGAAVSGTIGLSGIARSPSSGRS